MRIDHWTEQFARLAAAAGQQLQLDREHQDQHHPKPEIRQREAEDRTGHDAAADERMRLEASEHPARDADRDRKHQRDKGKFHRRRHALQDEIERGTAVRERLAEVARERVLDEHPELYPNRLIEAEPHRGLLALKLIGFRTDQDVDRVAKSIDPDEHQRRHHRHDQHVLSEMAEQEGEHADPSCASARHRGLSKCPGRHNASRQAQRPKRRRILPLRRAGRAAVVFVQLERVRGTRDEAIERALVLGRIFEGDVVPAPVTAS